MAQRARSRTPAPPGVALRTVDMTLEPEGLSFPVARARSRSSRRTPGA